MECVGGIPLAQVSAPGGGQHKAEQKKTDRRGREVHFSDSQEDGGI